MNKAQADTTTEDSNSEPAQPKRSSVAESLSHVRPQTWSVVLSLIVGLFMLEVFARLSTDPRAPDFAPERSPMLAYHETLGWFPIPSYQGLASGSSLSKQNRPAIQYDIGIDGFRRGTSPAVEEVFAERVRIAFLGGSSVFGLDVRAEQTLVHRFADEFQHFSHLVSLENFGVPEFSIDQTLLLLQETVLAKQPDIVVIVIPIDALFDVASPARRLYHPDTIADFGKPRFLFPEQEEEEDRDLIYDPPLPPSQISDTQLREWARELSSSGVLAWLAHFSALARYLETELHMLNMDTYFGKTEIFPDYRTQPRRWELLQKLILRSHDAVSAAGAQSYFVILPTKDIFHYAPVHPTAQDYLQTLCREQELECLSLHEDFIQNGSSVFQAHGTALSPLGHELVAKRLALPLRPFIEPLLAKRLEQRPKLLTPLKNRQRFGMLKGDSALAK